MLCEVEYTDQFEDWWNSLDEGEQKSVARAVVILEVRGITLGYPRSSGINGSRHGHMRELRAEHNGRPYRVLYAFDPKRNAILLIGGDKASDSRWYKKYVPIADDLYDEHLAELEREARHGKEV